MNKKWDVSFTSDQPEIMVARANKYSDIRAGIEEIASGNKKYMIVETETSKQAHLIAQTISAYRKKRGLVERITYATSKPMKDDSRQIVVWNPNTTEAPIRI